MLIFLEYIVKYIIYTIFQASKFNTLRGRPNEAREEHVYICEYRVDKTARLFNKISKHKHPTCTKFYAFTDFDLRLRLTRSYTVSVQSREFYVNVVKLSQSPGCIKSF